MTEQHIKVCGCEVTFKPGHTLTKFCDDHYAEYFHQPKKDYDLVEPNNLDLIGG